MKKTFEFEKIRDLKHGANQHQNAALYSFGETIDYEVLFDKELTYSNLLNASVGLEMAAEFFDVATTIVVKNSHLLCVSMGCDLLTSYKKALDSDPVGQFNSTIVFTREVDLELAKQISQINLELVITPAFSNDAIKEFEKNKNIKLLKINTPLNQAATFTKEEITMTPFGAIIQEKDKKDLDVQTFKVLTNKKPQQAELEDMIFAFKVAKHVKSCATVIAKDLRTLAIVGGEANRIDSLETAYSRVCDSAKDSVVAMDSAITTQNNLQVLAQNRSSALIHPAGTPRDNQLAQYADKMNISIVATGIRHLKF